MLGSERLPLGIGHFNSMVCSGGPLLSTCQTHRPHSLCSSTESSWDRDPREECSGEGEYIALKDVSDLTFFPPKNSYILNTAVLCDLQKQLANTG